ncbi:hypothetical protein [Acinetobacter equi]|uniref:Uncharacterized protein n=1 Tax=Acinetobacter equi TaxID=1324350 RepID=A0A0N9V8V5_9GAMM|nr:hypothetical protein AOY20_08800 [Acinetobacter equi]
MLYLKFEPFDQPTQLSKVGNWVITFVSTKDDLTHILAITHVIPRQADQEIQIRRLVIQATNTENCWEILNIEAFNGILNQEVILNLQEEKTQQLILEILKEFNKYDVSIQLISEN